MSEILERIVYKAPPTCRKFHHSPAFFRGLKGPVGSGKSTACVMEIYIKAQTAEPCRDGVRRTRFVAIRNTYPELKTTTVKTWEHWFGPDKMLPKVIYDSPIRWRHRWRYNGVKPDVELEMWFLSLDRPDDVNKLKSMDATGIWINEASELPKAVLDMATSRVGRYPHPGDKPDSVDRSYWPSWRGVIADTNSMDDDHWWYTLAEEEKPDSYAFFTQPGGFEQDAENIDNLPGGRGYYTMMAQGKRESWIKVFIDCQYGNTADGRPVWPEFSERLHVSEKPLGIYRGLPLWLGYDAGLTPACVACQVNPRGQVRVLREWLVEGGTMAMRQFASTIVKPALQNEFSGMQIKAYADPGANSRAETDETTVIDVLNAVGIYTKPARTNLFTPRRDCVSEKLTQLVDGEPAFLLDPSCKRLRKGMNGAYRFKRVAVAGEERFTDVPDKNELSHCCDALQYCMLHIVGDVKQNSRPQLRRPVEHQPLDSAFGY